MITVILESQKNHLSNFDRHQTAPVGYSHEPRPVSRQKLFFLAAACLVAVAYGSLVPLQYNARSIEDALYAFLNIQYLNLGAVSRADWVSNIILYIPMGFLWTAAVWPRRWLIFGPFVCVFALGICMGTALCVEFTQLFFPPRTVSINDLLAETIGSIIGIGLWLLFGKTLMRLWVHITNGTSQAVRSLLILYLLVYVFLCLFPYDFLISRSEIYWKMGQLNRHTIFLTSCNGNLTVRCAVKLVAEILAMVPVGFLLSLLCARNNRISYSRAFIAGAGLGLFIEGVQFFMVSGISQGASVLTRPMGILVGLNLFRLFQMIQQERARLFVRWGVFLLTPLYLFTMMVLNRWTAGSPISFASALDMLSQAHFMPFYYHYYSTEPVALASLLSQAGMYAPIGLGFWALMQNKTKTASSYLTLLVALFGSLTALVMEFGRLWMSGLHPDLTNILIAAASAALTHRLAILVTRWSIADDSLEMNRSDDAVRTSSLPTAEMSSREEKCNVETISETPGITQRILSLSLFGSAAAILVHYPILRIELAIALVVYAFILSRFHSVWLVIIPALLPIIDFAPWSGWFFFDEFDLFVLTTLAVNLWTTSVIGKGFRLQVRGPFAYVLLLLAVSYAVSLWIGLSFWPLRDLNSFSHYYSPYNSLRVAKGFLWAVALLPFLKKSLSQFPKTFHFFSFGMILGLTFAGGVTLIERYLFTGLFDFSTPFRITGMFSSMHIGGQHIDAYLIMALPFIFTLFIKKRSPRIAVFGFLLFAITAYTVSVTFSRCLFIAVCVSLLFLVVGMFATPVAPHGNRIRPIFNIILWVTIAGVILIPILTTGFMRYRFQYFNRDLETRIQHWRYVSSIRDKGLKSVLFGMGLGSFPRLYAARSGDTLKPGMYEYLKEDENTYVRLHSGRNIYFGQIVKVKPNRRYRLSLDIRSRSPGARISIPICEKTILYSFRCVAANATVRSSGGAWEHREVEVDMGRVGEQDGSFIGRFFRRPVTLALFPSVSNTTVDVDNIRLIDETGKNLMSNGDFEAGNDRWFFGADDHLAWHIKNMWGHLYFERGLMGIAAFALLLIVAGYQLLIRIKHGGRFAVILATTLLGLLIVGIAGSVFDAPRIAFLVYLIAFMSILRPSYSEDGLLTDNNEPENGYPA